MLQASDVGQRVVVRRRVGVGPTGRPLHTDLLGELVAIDASHLVVRTDDGLRHTVALAEVTAAKPIPPRPVRHTEIIAVERIADEAWPAPVRHHLGGWVLRAAGGWTNRANSALPLGDPGMPLDQAISTCITWYEARGLTPRVSVPLPVRRALGDALIARGWHAQPPVLLQTAALADILAAASPPTASSPPAGSSPLATSAPMVTTPAAVQLLRRPSPEFLAAAAARKRSLPDAAYRVLCGPAEVRFAEVRFAEIRQDQATNTEAVRGEGPPLVAMARGALAGEGSWLHLALVEVREELRGQGLGGLVTAALAAWAAERGASRALLQVDEENLAARALYARMGFVTHHRYIYYHAPASQQPLAPDAPRR